MHVEHAGLGQGEGEAIDVRVGEDRRAHVLSHLERADRPQGLTRQLRRIVDEVVLDRLQAQHVGLEAQRVVVVLPNGQRVATRGELVAVLEGGADPTGRSRQHLALLVAKLHVPPQVGRRHGQTDPAGSLHGEAIAVVIRHGEDVAAYLLPGADPARRGLVVVRLEGVGDDGPLHEQRRGLGAGLVVVVLLDEDHVVAARDVRLEHDLPAGATGATAELRAVDREEPHVDEEGIVRPEGQAQV